MESQRDFWLDMVDMTHFLHDKFPDICLGNFETHDHLQTWENEEVLFLKKSDFVEHKGRDEEFKRRKKYKCVDMGTSIEEVSCDYGNAQKIESEASTNFIERILIAEPVQIEFHNFRLHRQYRKIVVIQNVSKSMARYHLGRRFDASKLRVIWETRNGDRRNLAPGMSTILTLIFKARSPEDYEEKIIINVEGGLPILIDVIARRDPPILIDVPSPVNLMKPEDNLILYEWDFHVSPHRISLSHLSNEGELDCHECLVGDKKIIETRITNVGTSGRFFIISESDWHSKNITDLTDTTKLVTANFTLWPAYFHLERNQPLFLRTFFTPKTSGFHTEKLFLLCDNFSIQSFELLGDGLMFSLDFFHFSSNLERKTFSPEIEQNGCSNYFVTDVDEEAFSTAIFVSNLSQFQFSFRWDITNELCLEIFKNRGIFPPFSTATFSVFSRNCSDFFGSTLRLILEDLPIAAVPEEYSEMIRGKMGKTEGTVDLCVANISVRVPRRPISNTCSSEGIDYSEQEE